MVRLLHWLIRFYQIAISPLLDRAVVIFQLVLNIPWKQSRCMALGVECGWLLNVFAVVIRGGSGYDPVPSKAIRFISFQQIDSQTLHVAVPFRDRLLNQNHSHHLG